MIDKTDFEKWYGLMDVNILDNEKMIKQMDAISKKTIIWNCHHKI